LSGDVLGGGVSVRREGEGCPRRARAEERPPAEIRRHGSSAELARAPQLARPPIVPLSPKCDPPRLGFCVGSAANLGGANRIGYAAVGRFSSRVGGAACATGRASPSSGPGVRMNAPLDIARRPSVCPHGCPSVCALDVEVIGGNRIGRVHGAADHPYTQGVVCAKVARYAERIHHPDRLTQPLKCVGPKGSGQFTPIAWDEALDRVAEAFLKAEREHGSQSVWPYFYAGTMGLVMRDGIERLTHAKRYSRFFGTICVGIAWPGYIAGTGR